MYIYYRGLANRHGPYEGSDDADQRGGGIGLATLCVDGFASLAASYDGGRVTTKALRYAGNKLQLNVKADSGQILVECLDEKG